MVSFEERDGWGKEKGEDGANETESVSLLCMCLGTHTVRPEHVIYFRILMSL